MLSSSKLNTYKKIANPFEVERLRGMLASESKFSELSRTYSSYYPEIKDKNLPKLWDILNKESEILTEKDNPMLNERLKIVADIIKGDNLIILNVGFGSANLEKIFFNQKKNFEWYGIDISRLSVINASKKYPQGSFNVGNVNSINFKDNYFNYVIGLEILEHIKPSGTFKALAEIYRVLKVGGKLIISVPLNEGLEEMISRGQNPNAHVRIYTSCLIKAELKIAGFKILQEKKFFAFHNLYKIKTFFAKFLLSWKFKPNDIIIVAQKP